MFLFIVSRDGKENPRDDLQITSSMAPYSSSVALKGSTGIYSTNKNPTIAPPWRDVWLTRLRELAGG